MERKTHVARPALVTSILLVAATCTVVPTGDDEEVQASFPQFTRWESETKKAEPPPGKALLYVRRGPEFTGGAAGLPVRLNGAFFGKLGAHTYTAAIVAPGTHVLAAMGGNGWIGLRTTLAAGDVAFFDVEMTIGSEPFTRLSDQEGREYLAEERLSFFSIYVRDKIFPGLPRLRRNMPYSEVATLLDLKRYFELDGGLTIFVASASGNTRKRLLFTGVQLNEGKPFHLSDAEHARLTLIRTHWFTLEFAKDPHVLKVITYN